MTTNNRRPALPVFDALMSQLTDNPRPVPSASKSKRQSKHEYQQAVRRARGDARNMDTEMLTHHLINIAERPRDYERYDREAYIYEAARRLRAQSAALTALDAS